MTVPDLDTPGIDFSWYIDEKSEDFIGRDWVFERLNNWLKDNRAKPNFVLFGEPGSGKSAIGAQLAKYSQGSKNPSPGLGKLHKNFLAAVHFCSAKEPLWIDPRIFAHSISTQLADRFKEYRAAVREVTKKFIQINQNVSHGTAIGIANLHLKIESCSPQETFNRLCLQPLEVLMRARPQLSLILLIDGLDESLAYSGDIGICHIISNIGKLSSRVHFIITSRRNPFVESQFPGASFTISDPQFQSQNQADLRAYVSIRMPSAVPDAAKSDLLHRLTVQGNFLYAKFALRVAAKNNAEGFIEKPLPDELGGLIHEWLTRLLVIKQKSWANDYGPILGVLLVAQEKLTEQELQGLCDQSWLTFKENLFDLEEFFSIEETSDSSGERTYSFFHESFRDFLSSAQISLGEAELRNRYYISSLEQHRRIVGLLKGGASSWRIVNWRELSDYDLRYVTAHLAELGKKPAFVRELNEVICPEFFAEKRRRWKKDDSFLADLSLLAKIVKQSDEPDFAAALRSYFIRAEIRTSKSFLPRQAIAAMAWAGNVETAAAWAQLRADPFDYIGIVKAALARGDSSAADEFLKRAVELITVRNSGPATSQVLEQLYVCGKRQRAAEMINRAFEQSKYLGLPNFNVFEQLALGCIKGGDLSTIDKLLFSFLKPHLGKQAREDDSGGLFFNVASASYFDLITRFITLMFNNGRQQEALGRLRQNFNVLKMHPHPSVGQARLRAAMILVRAGETSLAKELVDLSSAEEREALEWEIRVETDEISSLLREARHRSDSDLFSRAAEAAIRRGELDVVVRETDAWAQDLTETLGMGQTFSKIALALARKGNWHDAVRIAGRIISFPKVFNELESPTVWEDLGDVLASSDQDGLRVGISALEDYAMTEKDNWNYHLVTAALAYGFAGKGFSDEALRRLDQYMSEWQRAIPNATLVPLSCEVAACFDQHGQDEAWRVIDFIQRYAGGRPEKEFKDLAAASPAEIMDGIRQNAQSAQASEKANKSGIHVNSMEQEDVVRAKFEALFDRDGYPKRISMRADLSDVKLSVLSEIGAEAVRIYGAKSVVVAIYNSSPEIFRSNTIETIQQDLFKRRAWMKLKTFALEHLDHLSELFDAEDFYQAITAYVPLLWGVDNGATLREVFEAYKSATEFQSVL